MRRPILPLASLALALVLPTLAHADDRPYNPTIEWRPTEFPWESGYVPASGPLRVNLAAALYQEVLVAMQGTAEYDWDARTLAYHGTPDTGIFRNTLGAEVTATIAVDALGVMLEYEVGVWNIEEIAAADFTPYLLPGNLDRPALIATAIGPFELANEPFSVGPLTGTFELDYMFDVPGISFAATQVALDDAEGPGAAIAVHDVEDEVVDAILPDAAPGELTTAWATMHGDFDSQVALHLYPTVTIDIAGVPFAIGPLDLVVDYPILADEPVVFEDLPLMYEVPEAAADSTSDDGGTTTGAADGAVDDDGPAPTDSSSSSSSTGEPGTSETGAAGSVGGGFGEDAGSGCGCSSGSHLVPSLLVWLLPIALRRRTRSTCDRR